MTKQNYWFADLRNSINTFESLRMKYPDKIQIYQYLGELYFLRSVKLANAGKISTALVDAQKAIIFDPYKKDFFDNKDKLIQLMQAVQGQVEKLKEQVSKQPNMQLTGEGKKMVYEANTGFSLMNQFINSKRAKIIGEKQYMTYAKSIWSEIRLTKPNEDWDKKAKDLFDKIGLIFMRSPKNREELDHVWQKIEIEEKYTDQESKLIHKFIAKRLWGETEIDQKQESKQNIEAYPVLNLVSSNEIPDRPPVTYWLYSWQDARIKFQAVAAIFLVFFAVYLFAKSSITDKNRNNAYQEIVTAQKTENHLAVIQNAERFLNNPPLKGNDGRFNDVREIYQEAFVKWFVDKEDELTNQDEQYIENYKLLSNN